MQKSAKSQLREQNLLQHDRSYLERGFTSLAGVDEAGRGPLAGPVVASAVIVRDFSFSSSVNDSKKMSAKARQTAYDEIMAKCVVATAAVDHDTIDRVNIFQATMQAMQQAVSKLSVTPDGLLIDGPKAPNLPFKQFAIIDGDALSFSIACASIIAKVTRDRMMEYYDTLYPEYGFGRHKGYGTQEHVEALRKHGVCPIHRKSFEPVKSLVREN